MGEGKTPVWGFCLNLFWRYFFLLSLLARYDFPFPEGGMALPGHFYLQPQKLQGIPEPEKILPESAEGMGMRELPRNDGGKGKIYFSVTSPEEEKKALQEEKKKVDKFWEMLRNVIIDNR